MPDSANDRNRRYRKRLAEACKEKLGGKCVQCGIDDWRVLQFDHIFGGGKKDDWRTRSNRIRMFRGILNGTRTDIQLLCANCHLIKTIEQDSGTIHEEITKKVRRPAPPTQEDVQIALEWKKGRGKSLRAIGAERGISRTTVHARARKGLVLLAFNDDGLSNETLPEY